MRRNEAKLGNAFLILRTIKFLGRQGLALRGNDDERNLNFMAINSTGAVSEWLKRKADKYTSPDIQNEILKLLADY